MTHGETYLVEHAPNFVRTIAGFEPHKAPRPAITQIDQADIYLDIVQPILKANCVSCHNDSKAKGQLNLANIEGIKKGGKIEHTLGDGKLSNSELYKRITLDEHDKKFMPAEGKTPLTDTQVKTIAWWIKAGAPMSGTLQASTLSKEDKKALSQTLGLAPADNAWPLAKRTEVPGEVIGQLQKQEFLVKTIASKINYLDVDYSSNLQAISDDAISALVSAKDYIAYLNLINSQITQEQIAEISQLPNLLRLRLNKTPVSDEGIRSLQTLPNLEYLNLFGTQISDSSLRTLTEFPSLKQVYVGQTGVTQTAISEIVAIKPDLQVFALSNKLAEFQESTKQALGKETKKAAK
nr:c-type cytochrome domain-containing protein [Paraglaciecola sp. G1-23]